MGQSTSDFRVALAELPAANLQVLRQQRLGFVVSLLRAIHFRQVALGQDDDRVVLRAAPQELQRPEEQGLGLAVTLEPGIDLGEVSHGQHGADSLRALLFEKGLVHFKIIRKGLFELACAVIDLHKIAR